MEAKIYVIGDPSFVLGFRLAGIKNTVEIAGFDLNEYMRALDEIIKKEDAGLVIVNGSDFEKIPLRKRMELESMTKPIIVALSERMDASETLRNKIIQAVGVDLLK